MMATVPVVHRFSDLEKKKLRNVDCCSGLLATFSKKKKNIDEEERWRRRSVGEGGEGRLSMTTTRQRTARGLLFFGRRCTGVRE